MLAALWKNSPAMRAAVNVLRIMLLELFMVSRVRCEKHFHFNLISDTFTAFEKLLFGNELVSLKKLKLFTSFYDINYLIEKVTK